ncbi:MAG: hypothetical protein FD180_107 [Planctomycetota bacterium]|nr:MAG: hypothetical protein FD180_107 [Planctomycetota bacterium]
MPIRLAAAFLLAAASAFAGDPPKGPTEKEAKDRVEALKGAKDETSKKKAIADAAKCPSASVAEALGNITSADDWESPLRIAAAEALGEMKGLSDAAKALAKGITANEKNPDVLKAIFRAMGKVGSVTAVPALKDFASKRLPLKDEKASSDLVVASIDALVAITCKASVEALFALNKLMTETATFAKKANSLVSQKIETGLKALLPGLPKKFGGEEWIVWWDKNEATFNDDLTPKK